MIATETFDPRDPWMKTRRMELVRYAAELGLTEIVEQMPKDLMIKRFKALGIKPPSVPPRTIGKGLNPRSGDTTPNSHKYNGTHGTQQQEKIETVTIDADELAESDWKAKQQKSVENMTWHEMRAEIKARGIKLDRRWRMNDIKDILNGRKDAS